MEPDTTSGWLPPVEIPGGLRRDVHLLGETLGRVIEEDGGPDLLADVERLRAATMRLRANPTEANRQAPVDLVSALSVERAEDVARAFTIFFQLINIAEERSRVRYLAEESRRRWPVPDSIAAAVEEARANDGPEALDSLLERLRITPVLTAHPTEAKRRAVVEILKAIADELSILDDPRISRSEEVESHRRLFEQVAILWNTNQLRAHRPSPLDEVRATQALFDETIFWTVPNLYRELDHALSPGAGTRAPAFQPFLRWGTWIGGDRDGNPAVTADVTLQAAQVQSEHALRALAGSSRWLGGALSASNDEAPPSGSLLEALDRTEAYFPEEAESLRRWLPDTAHRRMLLLMSERLEATLGSAPGAYGSPSEFVADLECVSSSLADAGVQRLAFGELQHLIWQARTFGFHLASIEIRQHSSLHARIIRELAPEAAGDPTALHRLALEGWPDTPPPSPEAQEVLATLAAMSSIQRRLGSDACRRYVVSFTRSAADVVAVRALAKLAVPVGMELDVVPLFESREDLDAASDILDELAALPGADRWFDSRGRHLEIMLGYSDSAKDVGMLAANFALYRVQQQLTRWSAEHNIDLTLFHGRGGALGRGGGPTNRAISGQAPGSVAGRFKVTEQGEVVFARYANTRVAQRHLEQVTNAVLAASLPSAETAVPALEGHEATAVVMAEASQAAYRALVRTEGFAEFFARATPLPEIESLHIGSRPARRTTAADIESLRAIPWVFAWSQSRCNLPGWFGLGSGLVAVAQRPGGEDELREMYERWPFFSALIDNAELSLVKADMTIAQLYLGLGERPDIAGAIEKEFDLSERMVLLVTGHTQLLAKEPLVRHDIELRNPYIDALSFLQLRFLGETRRHSTERPEQTQQAERTSRLVHLTVNGVAAGLQNTG